MLTRSTTAPCLQLCYFVMDNNVICNMERCIEIDVEATQIAAVCLGIGTAFICRRQKTSILAAIFLSCRL